MYDSHTSYQTVPSGYVMSKPLPRAYDNRQHDSNCCACCCCCATGCCCCCVCVLLSLVALCLAAGLFIFHSYSTVCDGELNLFQKDFDFDLPAEAFSLHVSLPRGHVNYILSKDNRIHVSISEENTEDRMGVDAKLDNGLLSITFEESWLWQWFKCYRQNITIALPPKELKKFYVAIGTRFIKYKPAVHINLDIDAEDFEIGTGVGDVTVLGELKSSDLGIASGTGSIHVKKVYGTSPSSSLFVHSGTGSVTIDTVGQGKLEISGGTGDLTANLCSKWTGSFIMSTGTGSTTVQGDRYTLTENAKKYKEGFVETEEGNFLDMKTGTGNVVLNTGNQ
ncbi:hypothetical protein GEMRC1_010485 [Eukaryota sp. GEM-RC1]